jgi:predicted alpha/beta-fold hydrolase
MGDLLMSDTSFKAAWWLRNRHLQTIWPALLKKRIKQLPLERERVELPDGDFIDLDWLGRSDRGPIVLMLHGFEGSIESHYAKSMLLCIREKGWRAVFMHFRGLSGEPNRLPRGYHSGETADLDFIVNLLHSRETDLHLSAIGYSLGGNVLLKWLGETSSANPLKAAVAISVPFDLKKASTHIKKGFSRFYQWYLLKSLKNRLVNKFSVVKSPVDPALLLTSTSIDEFDSLFTVPMYGFKDVDHYYEVSSSRQYLSTIKVPTLILHAKDDPFMSEDVIPQDHELSEYVTLEVTEAGGHVGFVSGMFPWRAEYWLEKRIPLFLQEHC